MLEFISDKKQPLPAGEIFSGIPQSWIDEEKEQLLSSIRDWDADNFIKKMIDKKHSRRVAER